MVSNAAFNYTVISDFGVKRNDRMLALRDQDMGNPVEDMAVCILIRDTLPVHTCYSV